MTQGTMMRMTMADGAEVGVYRAVPAGVRKGGLVVVQEIFGITEHIREVADSFAAEGYEVLAPALFDREHPGFEADYTGADLERAVELARDLHPLAQSIADVQACVDALDGPVFVVGYCYGGSIAWYAATRMHGVAAAAAYYGRVALERSIDEEPRVPVQLHLGRFDRSIPMEWVQALEAKSWPNAEVFVYEAGHGFNSDRRKDYHEPSAELARARTLELFRANGG